MKKLFAVIIALSLMFTLAGCGYSQDDIDTAKDKAYDRGFEEGYAAALDDLVTDLPPEYLGHYYFKLLDDNNFLRLYLEDGSGRNQFEIALDYFGGNTSREDAVSAIIAIWLVCDNILNETMSYY